MLRLRMYKKHASAYLISNSGFVFVSHWRIQTNAFIRHDVPGVCDDDQLRDVELVVLALVHDGCSAGLVACGTGAERLLDTQPGLTVPKLTQRPV